MYTYVCCVSAHIYAHKKCPQAHIRCSPVRNEWLLQSLSLHFWSHIFRYWLVCWLIQHFSWHFPKISMLTMLMGIFFSMIVACNVQVAITDCREDPFACPLDAWLNM